MLTDPTGGEVTSGKALPLCVGCGERPQHCKGLCSPCYKRNRRAQLKDAPGSEVCVSCGNRPRVYKSLCLCRPCYKRNRSVLLKDAPPGEPCVSCGERSQRCKGLCSRCYRRIRRRLAVAEGREKQPIAGFNTPPEMGWPFASFDEYKAAVEMERERSLKARIAWAPSGRYLRRYYMRRIGQIRVGKDRSLDMGDDL